MPMRYRMIRVQSRMTGPDDPIPEHKSMTMMKQILQSAFPVLLGSLVLTSCYPDEYDNLADLDVVQTQYDQDFQFGTRDYYLMPDTVPLITAEEDYTKDQDDINLDDAILEEIAIQMGAAGYTRLSAADTTDGDKMNRAVILLASRSLETYSGYYYDYYYSGYDYWGNYYGFNYYYPGYRWNYYYPWGYPIIYSYGIGTVILEMVDPAEPPEVDDENGQVVYPVRWMAVMNGLAEMSVENTEQRIRDGIIQAFGQSPYLY